MFIVKHPKKIFSYTLVNCYLAHVLFSPMFKLLIVDADRYLFLRQIQIAEDLHTFLVEILHWLRIVLDLSMHDHP